MNESLAVSPRQKRVSNACTYCRRRKIRCSGNEPCNNCTKRKIHCHFDEESRKVKVSESYLQRLERLVDRGGQLESADHGYPSNSEDGGSRQNSERNRPSPSVPRFDDLTDAPSNPLVSATSAYVKDKHGNNRFLGPSSTWSFSRRVFALLRDHFPNNDAPEPPVSAENSAYELKWPTVGSGALPDLTGLPSLDYSLYLVNTVKFHACQLLRLFDEEVFLRNMHEFYADGPAKVNSSRLWFVQYLLVIALGKGFSVTVRVQGTPPGSVYFQRAMAVMPDFVTLTREPFLAVEVLCMAAVYLMSVDMKNAAYGYVHQALSICIIEGLHRDMPVTIMGRELAERCRNIWWTVYTLDRQLSSTIGAPCSVQDVDITSRSPSDTDQSISSTIFGLNVQLSKVTAQVLNSVYSVSENSKSEYLKMVQTVLRDMAGVVKDIESVIEANHSSSIRSISGVANHLILSYHQCVVLAIRPLLLHLLSWHLNHLSEPPDSSRHLSNPIKKLLETCMQSATYMIKVLSTLHEHHLLDSFFPFDLEHAFSSAFVLTLASAILPSVVPEQVHESVIPSIFEYLVRKGSIPAQLCKHELDYLKHLLAPFSDDHAMGVAMGHNTRSSPQPLETLENYVPDTPYFGLSPTQMLSMADQLDSIEMASGADFLSPTYWLWSTADVPDFSATLPPNA